MKSTMIRISLDLPENEFITLEELCEQESETKRGILRKALKQYNAKHTDKRRPKTSRGGRGKRQEP